MFQKIDVYVVLILTNIIIGQLNTKLYDSDNGIPKFCICENLETHFHLVLFEHWHENICSLRFKISMRVPLEPKLSVLDVFFGALVRRRYRCYEYETYRA